MRAAANNAALCDAVVTASGGAGVFEPDLWFSRGPPPPYYPGLVTLTPDGTAAQLGRIAALGEACTAVKDSFATLDLAPLGFRVLFEAAWLLRPASTGQPAGDALAWERVRGPEQFRAWVAAWADGGAEMPFAAALLADERHAFLAGRREGRIVAGCVASRAAGVLGISNLFGAEALWPSCLATAQAWAPGLPLCTYDRGAAAEVLLAEGFQRIGPLRVWQRQDAGSK